VHFYTPIVKKNTIHHSELLDVSLFTPALRAGAKSAQKSLVAKCTILRFVFLIFATFFFKSNRKFSGGRETVRPSAGKETCDTGGDDRSHTVSQTTLLRVFVLQFF